MQYNLQNINRANQMLCQKQFQNAMTIYESEISNNNAIAYFWKAITLIVHKSDFPEQIDIGSINIAISEIKGQEWISEDIKSYIINVLYQNEMFDFLMQYKTCIAYICQMFDFDHNIVELFFSYYLNENINGENIDYVFYIENEIVSFSAYIRQKNPELSQKYSTEILNYAKKEFQNGNYYVFPYFLAAIKLEDNDENRFYYYLSILCSYMHSYQSIQIFETLLKEHSKTHDICRNLLAYRYILANTILNELRKDFSINQNMPNEQLNDFITSRINVISCTLQIIDGYYMGMEKEIKELIDILKFYIEKKLLGNGIDNNIISTFCIDKTEYKLLLHMQNETLKKFGRDNPIKDKLNVHYPQHKQINIIIPYIERDVDMMFAYAAKTLVC